MLMQPPTHPIREFQGDFRFLSNFWPAPVEYQGIPYPTVEHAYQALKTFDLQKRRDIAALPTPGDAKRAARRLILRPDWNDVRVDIMRALLKQKFALGSLLGDMLLHETGTARLEEGNHWGDRFWGISPPGSSNGQNVLGKLLMDVREELRRERR